MTLFLITNSWKRFKHRSCLQREQEVKTTTPVAFYLPTMTTSTPYALWDFFFFHFSLLHKVFQLHFLDKLDSVISCIILNMYILQSCPNTEQYCGMWKQNMDT